METCMALYSRSVQEGDVTFRVPFQLRTDGSAYEEKDFEIVRADKAILCLRSERFKALLTNGMAESMAEIITIVDASSDVFRALLYAVYTEHLPLDLVDVAKMIALRALSHRYVLSSVENAVVDAVLKKILTRDVASEALQTIFSD